MAQFDVIRARSAAAYSLVVDVQADAHSKLFTRMVVPLVARARYLKPTTRLTPILRMKDEEYVVLVPLMASLPKTALGDVVGSFVQHREALIAALGLLITGS